MASNEHAFDNGDWVVHRRYGVAQIVTRERKAISGEEKMYYKLQLPELTLWATPRQLDSEVFRPLVTLQRLQEIREVLTRPARTMSDNFNSRKARIQRVARDNQLIDIARLVRDLRRRRTERRNLNQTEESALRQCTNKLVHEWAACLQIDEGEARARIERLLRQSAAAVSA